MSVEVLSGLSELQYETASQSLGGCLYLPLQDGDDDHSLIVSMGPIGTVKELTEAFPGGEELTVFGRPGYFLDGALWAQLSSGTVTIEPIMGTGVAATNVDPVTYASAIADVVVPGLDAIAAAGPAVADAAPVEPSLCDAIPIAEINALGPLRYDEPFTANQSSCSLQASPTQAGAHRLSLFIDDLIKFEDLKTFFPGGEDVEVSGRAAYVFGGELYVDLGETVLTVIADLAGSPDSSGMDAVEHALEVAAIAVPNLLDE